MFCDSCGNKVPDSARFCQNCGRQFPTFPIAPGPISSQVTQATQTPRRNSLKTIGFILAICVLGVFVLIILATRPRPETPERKTGNQSELSTHPSPAISTPAEKPPDPAVLKAAQKVLREKYAEETQKDLWRQGMEMTFQAHGTTLYVKYVLAGDAFAFQFHEQFLHDNAETLKGLGFKAVELSNGDNVWSWKLSE